MFIRTYDISRIGTDGEGQTGRTRQVVTGAGRQELLDKMGGSERAWIETAGAAGLVPWELKISTSAYVSWVCVGVQEFLRWEVRSNNRGWHGRLV